jgi:phenylalanyl-tRNA synthetase beta chain
MASLPLCFQECRVVKFTLSWLKDHLETGASLSAITQKLVSLGLEVESIYEPAKKLEGFVVAEIVEAGRHPEADRLSLCLADYGRKDRCQVVCGASNVRPGMKVAFAPMGVTIPSTGLPLKKGKIRNVESFGMFCSAAELELSQESDGILDLPSHLYNGMPLAEALKLDDPVIDISVTPNRSDCFSIRGIARDLAAGEMGVLKPLNNKVASGEFACPVQVHVENNSACSDFRIRLIKNVKNGQSPEWVQARLLAVGVKPISALVDVTNYLTYDMGRPLHVFDAAKVKGNLVVRLSRVGELFQALNGKEYILESGLTVVADETGIISLAGIIGGQRTACDNTTVDVLVESAIFDAVDIARAGRSVQIISDARTRFERGVDPLSTGLGLDAATPLILEWCGGTAGTIVRSPDKLAEPSCSIMLTVEKLQGLGGCDISIAEAKKYLEGLGFHTLTVSLSTLTVKPPSYRPDIQDAVDLVEEVLRLKGYDQILAVPLPAPETIPVVSGTVSTVKRALAGRGLNEVVTWSFMPRDLAQHFNNDKNIVQLVNPISENLSTMRPSILPNLLQTAFYNQDRAQATVQIFEVGPQFYEGNQQQVAAGILWGATGAGHWNQQSREFDIFDAKAHVLAVLDELGITESSLLIEASGSDYYHPGRKGCFRQGNKTLAIFGEIHPEIISLFHEKKKKTGSAEQENKGATGYKNGHDFYRYMGFEIFLDDLPQARRKRKVLNLSPYQALSYDFSLVTERDKPVNELVKILYKVDTQITEVNVFDLYPGFKRLQGCQAVGIKIRVEPHNGTFTATQTAELHEKIIESMDKSGAILRKDFYGVHIKNAMHNKPMEDIKKEFEACGVSSIKTSAVRVVKSQKTESGSASLDISCRAVSTLDPQGSITDEQNSRLNQAIESITGGVVHI